MGAEYQDSLNNDEITQGGDTLLINESIDRVYLSPEKRILIHDPELKRTINIENKGHNTAVIWNPWQNMTQGMGDMADDGYKTMVCVESTYFAKSLESGITVKPNELFTLSTTISL
ncbi:hypothetical protein ACH42_04195 [Endozoicomonas sp. (ex Bugula neritina AB1)]|nr:hypothetical protein ACH42_04195 [Endozoicomonas sp. (ex Bugula neritina AB1)]